MTPLQGLTRDGHASDLGLEHVVAGDPMPAVQAHLHACEICQLRLDAMRLDEHQDLPPLALPRADVATPAVPRAANRAWMGAGLLVMAAAALLVALPVLRGSGPSTDDEVFRLKGNGMQLQVFRDEGTSSARLRDGDTVKAGDRLGFRVRHRHDGFLTVIGLDGDDEPYLCYPQSRDGRPEHATATLEPRALAEAIRMDDVRGTETLVGVLCDVSYTFETLARAVRDDALPKGCVSDRLTLVKP